MNRRPRVTDDFHSPFTRDEERDPINLAIASDPEMASWRDQLLLQYVNGEDAVSKLGKLQFIDELLVRHPEFPEYIDRDFLAKYVATVIVMAAAALQERHAALN
jgi:hypothetical protein